MADPYRDARVDRVVGIESRGFILGACVARELGVGFIPVRKPGKLPGANTSIEYALEYGTDNLAVHTDACDRAAPSALVDDVMDAGGPARAPSELSVRGGAEA